MASGKEAAPARAARRENFGEVDIALVSRKLNSGKVRATAGADHINNAQVTSHFRAESRLRNFGLLDKFEPL
jgi:hypothetical protein